MASDSRTRLEGLLGATAMAALVLATLLPTKWIPRTGLGWQAEHFIAYFVATFSLCIGSRRPIIVAVSLTMFAGILEALQGLTPDRFPDVIAALCGAAGVIFAATSVMILIRVRRAMVALLTPLTAQRRITNKAYLDLQYCRAKLVLDGLYASAFAAK